MHNELDAWLRYYRDLGFTQVHRKDSAVFAKPTIAESDKSTSILEITDSMKQPKSVGKLAEAGSIPSPTEKRATVPPVVAPNSPDLLISARMSESLVAIQEDLGDCQRCKLSQGRNKIVFGSGNPKAEIVFVGEGPGADEDAQGVPFVGRAGQLLTDMIEKGMKLRREDVYICNIVKCRPPENRKPERDEVAACRPFMERQIDAVKPKVICALGATAAETMLGTKESMGRLRGQRYEFHGIPLIVTYHPAFLLRDPTRKRDSWEDLKLVLTFLK